MPCSGILYLPQWHSQSWSGPKMRRRKGRRVRARYGSDGFRLFDPAVGPAADHFWRCKQSWMAPVCVISEPPHPTLPCLGFLLDEVAVGLGFAFVVFDRVAGRLRSRPRRRRSSRRGNSLEIVVLIFLEFDLLAASLSRTRMSRHRDQQFFHKDLEGLRNARLRDARRPLDDGPVGADYHWSHRRT